MAADWRVFAKLQIWYECVAIIEGNCRLAVIVGLTDRQQAVFANNNAGFLFQFGTCIRISYDEVDVAVLEIAHAIWKIAGAKTREDRAKIVFDGLQPVGVEPPANRVLFAKSDNVFFRQRLRRAHLAAFFFDDRFGLKAGFEHLKPSGCQFHGLSRAVHQRDADPGL